MSQGLNIWGGWGGRIIRGAKNLGGRVVKDGAKIWEGVRPPSDMPGIKVPSQKSMNLFFDICK